MKKYAIHIGLNQVDPAHYDGWDGKLNACLNDSNYYKNLSEKTNFDKVETLHDEFATSKVVLETLALFANDLQKHDLLFLTYAGHGASVTDFNNDEVDSKDETWCLYDRQLLDDELFEAFKKFTSGVQIFMVSDSCHSGTVARAPKDSENEELKKSILELYNQKGVLIRRAPAEVINRVFEKHSTFYLPIMLRTKVMPEEIAANLLLFSGCLDHETSKEFGGHGLFTRTFKNVVDSLELLSYQAFYEEIVDNIPKIQTPNLFTYGDSTYDFKHQIPFFNKITSLPIRDQQASSNLENLEDSEIIIHQENRDRKRGIDKEDKDYNEIILEQKSTSPKPWDEAYNVYLEYKQRGEQVSFVEANVESLMEDRNGEFIRSRGLDNSYLKNWPKPASGETEFIWHLDKDHSELKAAYEMVIAKVGQGNAKIRIGHIDTGYVPDHPSLPENLMRELGKSMLKGEDQNKGEDKLNSNAIAEQDGHGTATMALLAGGKIREDQSYTGYEGYFGAIPFAEVVPIRISDTVYKLFKANNVAKGIHYAIDHGCEVITMSMAGYPTKSIAKAVNRAYENGVVVVTAAGNNWFNGMRKITPKSVLFPAAFDRVVAASGACYNHLPYDYKAQLAGMKARSEGGEYMQGNWGPKRMMKTSIAGYTPNVAWAAVKGRDKFFRSGGGTSSSTPQIAAAFALWIAYNRENLSHLNKDEGWKKVEAARRAIFKSAKKNVKYSQYFGNGIIRAHKALNSFDFNNEWDTITKSKKAKVGFLGIIPFIKQWFSQERGPMKNRGSLADENLAEMVSLEILQIMYQDQAFKEIIENVDYEDPEDFDFLQDENQLSLFLKNIKDSEYSSDFLKLLLEP